jgi:hypothetical protein
VSTEILALVDHGGRQAHLLSSLERAFAARDLALRSATHAQLACGTSIEQTGGITRVWPDRPLLWLSPGHTGGGETMTERFVAFEHYSAARSIAHLSRSPVLNRPTATDPCGTLPASRVLAVRRAERALGIPHRAERFSSVRPDGPAAEIEVFDYDSGLADWGYPRSGAGPFRARDVRGRSTAARVVRVVGARTMAVWPVPAEIVGLSTRIARLYRLDLASLWWNIDGGEPRLARVDCWHWDGALGPQVAPLSEALAERMAEQLAKRPDRVAQAIA